MVECQKELRHRQAPQGSRGSLLLRRLHIAAHRSLQLSHAASSEPTSSEGSEDRRPARRSEVPPQRMGQACQLSCGLRQSREPKNIVVL